MAIQTSGFLLVFRAGSSSQTLSLFCCIGYERINHWLRTRLARSGEAALARVTKYRDGGG